jgi:hypothetical protein
MKSDYYHGLLGSADSAEEPVERRTRRASIVEGKQRRS